VGLGLAFVEVKREREERKEELKEHTKKSR
jgi:hypothetical protein